MNATASDIAIIGAGLSGLAAADALQAAGHRVQLFDKSRSTGGRLCTRRGEDWQADHGAQYFTARDPVFQTQVQQWLSEGVIALWQPRLITLGGDGGHRLDATLSRYVGVPRMGAPARQMSQGLSVQTQTTVNALQRVGARWQLHSLEQGLVTQDYDTVLLALPAAQATSLLQTCNSALALITANVTMRGCWTLMLRFAAPVDPGFDAAFINEGPLSWIARDSSKPQRTGSETWVAQASALWSQAHIEASADDILAQLLPAFTAWVGAAPLAASAHRWRYADSDPPARVGSLWSAAEQLGVCGDWLNGGRVEGAWLSGRHLAKHLLT
jgi:hypothetical protein